MRQDIVNYKTALQSAINPTQAHIIKWTLAQKWPALQTTMLP